MVKVQTNGSSPGLTSQTHASRFLTLCRWITLVVFAAAGACYVAFSIHWRMAVDTPVMHYVVFLLHHGLKPYSEITDNNMPGAYLTEAAAMAVFGWSDLAWRVYEFFLLAVLAVSAVAITRRRDWAAGIFGIGIFVVLHAAEGPQLAVERDLVIGVLLMAACALLFESVDRDVPSLLLLFGFASGLAAGIKPTMIPLPLALLCLAGLHLRRQRRAVLPSVLYATAGLLLAVGTVLSFLLRFHAFHGFAFILFHVVPAYRDISKLGFGALLAGVLPRAVLALTVLASPLALHSVRQRSWDWRLWSLAAAAGFGLLSYLVQGKGYVYHRYIFLLFLLVLIGTEIFAGLAGRGWPRYLAAAALLIGFSVIPGHLRSAHAVVGQSAFELTLERDLSQLGKPEQLDRHVQCFDLVYGCLDALYHLQLVDISGSTGDMLFFPQRISPPVLFYRERFWRYAQEKAPSVIVVSNGLFAEPNSYAKLARWPEFNDYLASNYTLAIQRSFPNERYTYHADRPFPPDEWDSYRLYIRNESPLLASAKFLTPDVVTVGK